MGKEECRNKNESSQKRSKDREMDHWIKYREGKHETMQEQPARDKEECGNRDG